MTTVFIDGLEFYAYHGARREERRVGHRYRLDVHYELDAAAVFSDRLEDTVDYATVAVRLQESATNSAFATLERLANFLLDDLFREFPPISSARLRVAKLLPPAPFIAEAVGVELTRSRS
jgi:dihydroneopterin aldolase